MEHLNPPPPAEPRLAAAPTLKTQVSVSCGLILLSMLLLAVDLPVARICWEDRYPKELSELLSNTEPFGHGIGVAFVVITIAVLDAGRRRWAPAICAIGALSGGIAANLLKLTISRTRPRNFDLSQTNVWDTFQGLLPLGSGGSPVQSFPSAHTATAMGFAVALAAVYPQGRWWFFTLATLVGLHRIEVSAHYPSDACAGAAFGWIAGQIWLTYACHRENRRQAAESQQTTPAVNADSVAA